MVFFLPFAISRKSNYNVQRKKVLHMAYHILLVDDESEIITMLQRFLLQNNYRVSCAMD